MEAHGKTLDAFYDRAKQAVRLATDRAHALCAVEYHRHLHLRKLRGCQAAAHPAHVTARHRARASRYLLRDARHTHDHDPIRDCQRLLLVVCHVHEGDPDLALERLQLHLHQRPSRRSIT